MFIYVRHPVIDKRSMLLCSFFNILLKWIVLNTEHDMGRSVKRKQQRTVCVL